MTQERKAFEVDCRYGQHRIMMVPQPEGKWKPYDLQIDGTTGMPHNCRDQKNIQKQKPQQQGQVAFLSDSMTEAVRKIAKEEAEKAFQQFYRAMGGQE